MISAIGREALKRVASAAVPTAKAAEDALVPALKKMASVSKKKTKASDRFERGEVSVDIIENLKADTPYILSATDKKTGELLSQLRLYPEGHIAALDTNPLYTRQGYASLLYDTAKKSPSVPNPLHSPQRSALGDMWAKSIGDELPTNKMMISPEDATSVNWQYINDLLKKRNNNL